MAYWKHHRALCCLFKTPQSAMWCFILGFNIENWMARWLANISQLFSEIIWFFQFFRPQSALWPFQNTITRFVAYSMHHKTLCGCHRYHSDSVSGSYTMRTKLAEGLSYFDREVGKIFAPPLTLIVHAIFWQTRSFHDCCLSIMW